MAEDEQQTAPATVTVVLEVSGMHWATSKHAAEAVLTRRPGVRSVRTTCATR